MTFLRIRPDLAQGRPMSWQVLSTRYALKLSHFALRVDTVRTTTGVVHDDYPIIESRDWVCVVALDAEGNAVMVQQYRHGAQRETLEFVAGGVSPGEAPERAARRELREETGCEAEELRLLRVVAPDTTRHRNAAHIFLALGVREVGAQQLEPGEHVHVCRRHLFDDVELEGELSHAVHVLALLLARSAVDR